MLQKARGAVSTGAEASGAYPAPDPGGVVYAVGDVHGRADLLDEMLDLIAADAAADIASGGTAAAEIVLLGDYVDRGPDSREVLDRAAALQADPARRVSCLTGNHEVMMLEFLDQTGSKGHLWLDNGGLATLDSYGVGGLYAVRAAAAMERAAAELAAAMGRERIAWLRGLPRRIARGNVHFVHAAADPARAMDDQDPEMLIWGRPGKRRAARPDGQWIVHGHTIVAEPEIVEGRINVDTGAVRSGRLTAARLSAGQVTFLSTGPEEG